MGVIRNSENFILAYKLASEIRDIRKAKEKARKKRRMSQFEMSAMFNETLRFQFL